MSKLSSSPCPLPPSHPCPLPVHPNPLHLSLVRPPASGDAVVVRHGWQRGSQFLGHNGDGVVADTSKRRKFPPPARVWMQGRWWGRQTHRNIEEIHPQLAFGCEGGGSSGRRVERSEKSTSGSCWT